jgi:hypothetical protein
MMVEPRAALDRLTAALEAHLSAAASGRGEEDPGFQAAYKTLIDAFETYDEALYETYGVDTPFMVFDDDDDEEIPEEDDFDEDLDEEDFAA